MNLSRIFGRRFREDGEGDGNGGGSGEGDGQGNGPDGGEGDGKTLLGAGGDPKPGDGDGDGDGDSKPWFLADGVQGDGDAPEWYKSDKYKTVTAQAEAAASLEAKLGPAGELIGAPEDDYALPPVPEGMDGEWDLEDPMLKGFMPLAKEMNLSQEAFNKIATWGASVIAEQNDADAVALSDAIGQLGPKANDRIAAVDQYLINQVGEEGYQALQAALGTDVNAYLALEKVVAAASGDAQLAQGDGTTGPGFTKADAEAERYKKYPEGHPNAGRVMYEHDKEHRARVDEMFKKLYPGEDRHTVG